MWWHKQSSVAPLHRLLCSHNLRSPCSALCAACRHSTARRSLLGHAVRSGCSHQLACGFPRVQLLQQAAPGWSRCVPQGCLQRVAGWAPPPPATRAWPALVCNRSPSITTRLLRALLQVLFVHRELDVFRIPPRTGAGGCRSGEWRVSDRIFSGRCRVVAQGDALEVRLEDPTRWDAGRLAGSPSLSWAGST